MKKILRAGAACLFANLVGAMTMSVTAHAGGPGDTKYPIVLVHGLSGFDSAAGIDYFYGIESAMEATGAEVYAAQVTAFEDNYVRGEELLDYVEDVLAVTGASKVNLVGHSQGGMTARYVSGVRPDLVASVTSVGTPHFGSDTADLVASVPEPFQGIAADVVNGVGDIIAFLSGDSGQDQDALASLLALSSAGAAQFNADFPDGLRQGACQEAPWYNANYSWSRWIWPNWQKDYSVNDGAHKVNGVRYYSWTGIYEPLNDSNIFDLADGPLAIAWLTHDDENDGLVERCSSHLGMVIRDDYTLNHLDEVNQTLGLTDWWASDPVAPYVQHAQRLKSAGL